MTDFEKVASQALKFPEEKRAELTEMLIQSLDVKETEEIRQAWIGEIQRRYEEIQRGTVKCRPREEVLRDARERLRCLE